MNALITLLIILAGNPSPPPDASPARRGLVNPGTQTFGGKKSFVDGGIVTESITVSSGSSDAGFDVLTATNAAMTLYVDLDGGNDSSACTGGDGGVCATFAGAKAKLPRIIRHNVTINIAAATYATEAPNVDNVTIERSVTLAIVGATSPFTPATGTNAGTITSAAVGTATSPTVITDSTQSWTVNDLKYAWITTSAGTFPIISNTATSVTIPSTLSFSGAYSLVTIGTNFTGSSRSYAYSNIHGAGTLSFTFIRMGKATAVWGNATTGGFGPTLSVISCDFRMTGTSGAVGTFTDGSISLTRTQVVSNATSTAALTFLRDASPNLSNLFVSTATGAAVSSSVSSATTLLSTVVVEGSPSVSSGLVNNAGPGPLTATSLFVTCLGGTGAGIGTSSGALSGPLRSIGGVYVSGCPVGIAVSDFTFALLQATVTVNAATTAFKVATGGRLSLGGATPTFTGVTNEFQLDGVNYTFAQLGAAGPPAVLNNVYGSVIIK